MLLSRRWVVERDFAWAARIRRLAGDYERLAATLAALHFLVFACLMLPRFTALMLSPYQPLAVFLAIGITLVAAVVLLVAYLLPPVGGAGSRPT